MKKILCGDIHFGEKNNSPVHNQDLLDFFEWMIEWCKENIIDEEHELIICGDYFHQRDKINVETIDYAYRNMKILAAYFQRVVLCVGNHDLYRRDARNITSLSMFQDITNVEIVDFCHIEGDEMYTSWVITQEEYDEIIKVSKKKKIKTIYGHYEFSSFKMNDHYVMEHGQSHKELRHVERVFTGHYHGRQIKDNVVYLGSPIPINFNDANDSERGFCVYDPESLDYEFVDYGEIAIISLSLEEVLEADLTGLEKTSIRVVIDEAVDDDVIEKVKEKLEESQFRDTKVVYNTTRIKDIMEQETELGEIVSVDAAIVSHLKNMSDVEGVDKSMLIDMFLEAKKQDG